MSEGAVVKVVRQVETSDASVRGPASLGPLILAWVAGGIGAAATLVAISGFQSSSPTRFAVVLVLTVVAETAVVQLQAGRTAMTLSLLECVVVVAVLLLPPVPAATAVLSGILISYLVRRIAPQKIAFNLGQHAVAVSAAASIVDLAPAHATVTSPRLVAALVGILVYSGVNSVALAGIFARLGQVSFREQLTRRPGFLLATSIGNASVGAIVVTIWTTAPTVIWIVFGPALALYLSYGSNFRIESLLSEVSSERDHLDRVVSGVQEGIVLLDADGLVRLWNPAMARITGVSVDAALGRSATEFLAGVDADGQLLDPLRPLRSGTTTATDVVTLEGAHGDRVEVRIGHTLVDDDRGRLVGDVVMIKDLSREREAHALKEDFVARVSHELRTPLSPLRAYAQLMLRAGDRVTPEKREEILETMVERVGHLERLIDDLLLVSKVASGRLDPADEVDFEVVDVAHVAVRMTDWVAKEHPDRDVRVEVVPGADAEVTAWADTLRVSQVLTNLVKNACKYATPGTPVEVEVDSHGDEVVVVVRDHGPGIPDDKLEAIFDRFHRLEDPQRMRTNGIGLGLYISRHLADAMGGRLTVESTRGVGTAFTLSLPRARQAADAASADAPLEVLNPAV